MNARRSPTPRKRTEITTEPSVGRPVAVSGLAALLLRLHAQSPVRLVEVDPKKRETTE